MSILIQYDTVMDSSQLHISQFVGVLRMKTMPGSEEELRAKADLLCKKLGLTVVDKNSYAFTPIGQTLVYILSQSHISFHTWPEFNTIHIDLVSCKNLSEENFRKNVTICFENFDIIDFVSRENNDFKN